MAKCDYCGSFIIAGGVRQGEQRFCNATCAQRGALIRVASSIDPGKIQAAIAEIHLGLCPKCGGAGPVDVSTSHKVWSALVLTRWSSAQLVSCRSCGRKKQLEGALLSLVAGWWGFPWGLIMTPVQVIRNVAGMFTTFDPY